MARRITNPRTFSKHAQNKNFSILAEGEKIITYRIGEKIYAYKKVKK